MKHTHRLFEVVDLAGSLVVGSLAEDGLVEVGHYIHLGKTAGVAEEALSVNQRLFKVVGHT